MNQNILQNFREKTCYQICLIQNMNVFRMGAEKHRSPFSFNSYKIQCLFVQNVFWDGNCLQK